MRVAECKGSLTLFLGVVPGILLVRHGLGRVHQSVINRQLWHTVSYAGLVDQSNHLQPDLHIGV